MADKDVKAIILKGCKATSSKIVGILNEHLKVALGPKADQFTEGTAKKASNCNRAALIAALEGGG
jgi:hypothetical protein